MSEQDQRSGRLSVRMKWTRPGFALDLAFEAPAGVTALFGASGSGKSTVVNAVAGLLRPDQGRIAMGERVLFDSEAGIDLAPHRRAMGYVFQDGRLFPHLSVRQNLLYGQVMARLRRDQAGVVRSGLKDVVALLGIGPLLDRRPGDLSGGEKQRVAIGRALLSRPQMLLMDEPLAALDGPRKAQILPYLDRLSHALQLPVLYVTHDPSEVARLARTVVVLERGTLRRAGPVSEVMADPATARIFGAREMGAVLTGRVQGPAGDGLMHISVGAGALFLPDDGGMVAGQALRIRIHAQDVILSRDRPEGLSALNILPAVIREIRPGEGPGALVRLDVGEEPLLARITRKSVTALDLKPGMSCHAVLKTVALAKRDVGGPVSPADRSPAEGP